MKRLVLSLFPLVILSRSFCTPLLDADSTEKVGGAIAVVQQFYRWYSENCTELSSEGFLRDGGVQGKQYEIDFRKVDQFLNRLVSTGLFSETFPPKVNAFFARCNEKMFAMNQTEGPPIDLNYDIIFCSQEYDLTPEFVDFFTFSDVLMSGSRITMKINTPYEWVNTATLILTDRGWKIDRICEIK